MVIVIFLFVAIVVFVLGRKYLKGRRGITYKTYFFVCYFFTMAIGLSLTLSLGLELSHPVKNTSISAEEMVEPMLILLLASAVAAIAFGHGR